MSRIVQAQEAVVSLLKERFPEAHVLRSYTPTIDTQRLTSRTPTILVTVDDVTTPRLNSSWSKWWDRYTLTVYVGKRLISKSEITAEVDTLCGLIEEVRDSLRRRRKVSEGVTVQMIDASHASSRPIYDRAELEKNGIFSGFLLVEVQIDAAES